VLSRRKGFVATDALGTILGRSLGIVALFRNPKALSEFLAWSWCVLLDEPFHKDVVAVMLFVRHCLSRTAGLISTVLGSFSAHCGDVLEKLRTFKAVLLQSMPASAQAGRIEDLATLSSRKELAQRVVEPSELFGSRFRYLRDETAGAQRQVGCDRTAAVLLLALLFHALGNLRLVRLAEIVLRERVGFLRRDEVAVECGTGMRFSLDVGAN